VFSYFNKVFKKMLEIAAFLSWTKVTSEPEEYAENWVAELLEKLRGLLKRDGVVSIVPNCFRQELMPIIQGKILEGDIIYPVA
jgi:hypothetical protein